MLIGQGSNTTQQQLADIKRELGVLSERIDNLGGQLGIQRSR